MIFSIVMCCCCCIPFTSTITHFTGTVCVRSSWSLRQIQLFLHRSHVVINSDRLTNQIAIIVASFCISPFANWCLYLCLFTRYLHIHDDNQWRYIQPTHPTNRYQLSTDIAPILFNSTPQRLLCVCIVYCCVYECLRTSLLLLLLHRGWLIGALPSRQGTSSTESKNSWLT